MFYFKKTYWYKKELYDYGSESFVKLMTGAVRVPFWWSSYRVYNDISRDCNTTIVNNNSKWVITDFKRV